MIRAWLCALFLCMAAAWPAQAHEVRPAYLQLREMDAQTWDVTWKVPATLDERRLALHVVFAPGTRVVGVPQANFANATFLQHWRVQRAGGLVGTHIGIDGLASTLTDVLVRVERRDGTSQTVRVTPADPGFTLEATPGQATVANTYFALGVQHILTGFDHLLFVFALILLVRKRATLLWTVTAFTLAHSITLAAATLGVVHVPPPPVEASIALSIAFLASELIRQRRGEAGLTARRPWLVAFAFGLLHGLGFAGALSEVGLPQNAIPLALLFFNVGVEAGQLLFIVSALAVLAGLRRLPVQAPWLRTAAAYSIGGLAMFWTLQRIAQF
jgi:hydrogenase/urease accessory protein HupE